MTSSQRPKHRNPNTAIAVLKIGCRVFYEKLARPKVYTADQVPGTPYAITPRWLTATLCTKVPGAEVVGLEVLLASSGTHQRHKLKVTYNDIGQKAGLPTSIFTKSMPSIATRLASGLNGSARAEGRFYTQLRPSLSIEAPICYFTASDRNTSTGIHLFDDLAQTKQATFCNYRTNVTRAMIEDMTDVLSAIHGQFYNKTEGNDRFQGIHHYPRWFQGADKSLGMRRHLDAALDKAAALMPARLMERRAEIWPATERALGIHHSEPNVLLHADVHIGNWYQTGAMRMGLCDWQCVSRGHWARDLSYAISTALQPEERRQWERDLVARYLDRLANRGGDRIEFDRGFSFYRHQTLHAFHFWTTTLCHSPLLPAMQTKATTLEMMRRIAIAIDDLDALDSV
jgi:hypothetical protein